jgi:hypothetical protein
VRGEGGKGVFKLPTYDTHTSAPAGIGTGTGAEVSAVFL